MLFNNSSERAAPNSRYLLAPQTTRNILVKGLPVCGPDHLPSFTGADRWGSTFGLFLPGLCLASVLNCYWGSSSQSPTPPPPPPPPPPPSPWPSLRRRVSTEQHISVRALSATQLSLPWLWLRRTGNNTNRNDTRRPSLEYLCL